MYTKGKWEITFINGNLYIVSSNLEIAKLCIKPTATQTYRKEEIQANAERICHCVNNFDELLEACEEALGQMERFNSGFYFAECREKLNKAIAKAKKEGV
jgi:hypothetical protein